MPLVLCSLLIISAHLIEFILGFNLTLLHINDFHARYSEINAHGNECSEEFRFQDKCFGGAPRIAAKVAQLRRQYPNTLLLNAGDNFSGTIWHILYKGKIAAEFSNLLKFDAMTLGNHEFDDGLNGLKGFLKFLSPKIKVVASNIVFKNDLGLQKIKRSTILNVDGRKVGIIGYTTLSSSVRDTYLIDALDSIRKEIDFLQSQDVTIIIALGHAGLEKDIEIARKFPEIDVVVGGHSHTFLYDGKPPSLEQPVANYPIVVRHSSGRKTLIVTAYAYGKYLGVLSLFFDELGNVIKFNGNPILLDKKVPNDATTQNLLKNREAYIKATFSIQIGTSLVFLNGDYNSCRKEECNVGNLITDAFVNSHLALNTSYKQQLGWTEFPIAIIPGGSIRGSIDERSTQGHILLKDLFTIMPFRNKIHAVELLGSTLKEIFEHSVSSLTKSSRVYEGRFLQVAGIKVVYDLDQPIGSRVKSLKVRCGETCRTPKYEDVVSTKSYKVLVTDYVANGGNSYSMLKNPAVRHIPLGKLDIDIVRSYVSRMSPVSVGLENRIIFETTATTPAFHGPPVRPPVVYRWYYRTLHYH